MWGGDAHVGVCALACVCGMYLGVGLGVCFGVCIVESVCCVCMVYVSVSMCGACVCMCVWCVFGGRALYVVWHTHCGVCGMCVVMYCVV